MENYLKKILKISLIAGCFIISPKTTKTNLEERLELESQKLQINHSKMFYYKTKKSEREGIIDLSKISKEQDCEESWLYLPKTKAWYEIGKKSEKEKTDSSIIYRIKRDTKKVRDIIKNQKPDSMIFYHIHPQSKYSYLPSNKDIITMMETTLENQNGHTTHKIVSGDILTEYYLTEKGINYFRKKKKNILEKTNENFERKMGKDIEYGSSFLNIKFKQLNKTK